MTRSLLVLFLILLPIIARAEVLTPEQEAAPFVGEITSRRIAPDTVLLSLDLVCTIGQADSIAIGLVEDYNRFADSIHPGFTTSGNKDTVLIIYRLLGETEAVYSLEFAPEENSLRIRGDVTVALNGADARDFDFEMRVFHQGSNYHCLSDIQPNPKGMRGTLLAPSYGIYDSQLPGELNKSGIFLGWSLGTEWNKLHYSLALETSWSGIGRNFSFSNPLRASVEFYPFNRNRFSPYFEVGGKLSKIKVKEDDLEYRTVKWGGDFGGGFSTSFDRISYNYSAVDGGFHTIELFLGAGSGEQAGRFGTLYRFRLNDKIKCFEILGYISGISDIGGYVLGRDSRHRPKPLRLLAGLGLIPLKIFMRGMDH